MRNLSLVHCSSELVEAIITRSVGAHFLIQPALSKIRYVELLDACATSLEDTKASEEIPAKT